MYAQHTSRKQSLYVQTKLAKSVDQFALIVQKILNIINIQMILKIIKILKFKQNKIKYNTNLITQLNLIMENVLNSFQRIKQGIDDKYNLSIKCLNVLSSDKFIQYIDNMIQFEEYQVQAKNQIQSYCTDFEQKLNTCLIELQLNTLTYNVVSYENKRIALKLYKQGYDLYWEKRDYSGAINFFDQALIYDRNHVSSLLCKGISLRKKRLFKDSLETLKKALLIDPKHINCMQGVGDCLKFMGQLQDAIEWYNKILSINDQDVDALCSKGTVLRRMGLFKEALELQKKAFAIDPKHIDTLSEYGTTLNQLNQFSEALIYLDQALQLDQIDCFSLGSKGASLVGLQKYDEAQFYLNKSLEINPNNLYIQNQLSKILIESRNMLKQDEITKQLNQSNIQIKIIHIYSGFYLMNMFYFSEIIQKLQIWMQTIIYMIEKLLLNCNQYLIYSKIIIIFHQFQVIQHNYSNSKIEDLKKNLFN